VELMPGGVAAFDYNGDGCTDIYFTNGAPVPDLVKTGPAFFNRLYRNNCKGTFTDVTDQAGVRGEDYSIAAAAADYDNDGDIDLFVAGVNRNILYRNSGDGHFEDVTATAGLQGRHPQFGKLWSIGAGWFDADGDGNLDLLVSNYVAWNPASEPLCGTRAAPMYCHPDRYAARPHQLYRNSADGTFEDVTAASGIGH
jgi:enediyne biosynthesis protein E4